MILSHVMGKEHKKICGFLLGLIIDLLVPGGMDSSHVVKVVCTLLDFLFLAQFQSHTSDTLSQLEDSLVAFHNNKAIFVDLGIREDFNIPKLHGLLHYASSICLFSTTDNYNTKQSKCLHINLAKNAYCATNHKDKYSQMTVWLECHKKIQQHSASIDWRQNNLQNIWTWTPIGALCMCTQSIKMAYKPSSKVVAFPNIFWKYGALLFQDRLGDFIAAINNPGLGMHALHTHSANTLLPFHTVRIYHNIKFRAANNAQELEIVDAVHVWLEQKDKRGQIIPARFDTVLVQGHGEGECFFIHTEAWIWSNPFSRLSGCTGSHSV